MEGDRVGLLNHEQSMVVRAVSQPALHLLGALEYDRPQSSARGKVISIETLQNTYSVAA